MKNNTTAVSPKSVANVRMLTVTAVLSAIAFLLAFIEFPVPLSPSFARMDLSDLPALIGAFACGPMVGVMIEFVKNVLQLPLFESFMPLDQLIASFGEFIPFIQTKLDVVLYNALPFNFLKGLTVSAVTMLLDQRLSPVLKGTK